MWSRTHVEGFHGTTVAAADSILRDGFRTSAKEWDWLGDGVYFFQDGPYRAREWAAEWAVKRYNGEAAVVGARIRLEREQCMDLIDVYWADQMFRFYTRFLELCRRTGTAIPIQSPKPSGPHPLDRRVVNHAVGILARQGKSIGAVRAAFEEGGRTYPDSAFYERAHVQIAVRDVNLIEECWVEKLM
jgi:hypothetical protein